MSSPSSEPAPPLTGRVLFLAPLPPPITGQSLACETLLDRLQQTHRVDVIDLMKGDHRQGFTSWRHALRVLGFVSRAFRRRRADVIYLSPSQTVAGNLKDCSILLALGRHRHKVVLHLHGGGIRETVFERSRWLKALNRWLLGSVRRVIVLGDSLRRVYADLVPESRLRVVPNFAADELYRTREEIETRFREDGPLEVLYLSTLFESKGYGELLAAAEELSRTDTGAVRLTIAGSCVDPHQERQLRERVARLPDVAYLGIVEGDRKREVLARAHVLCLPTSYPYEGQPLCILEAYASGCAVLTTAQGGIPDIFTPGVHGEEIEARSPASIVEALHRALANRDRLLAIALANRDTAERYRLETHLAALREILFED